MIIVCGGGGERVKTLIHEYHSHCTTLCLFDLHLYGLKLLLTHLLHSMQKIESQISGKYWNILVFPSSLRIIQALQSLMNLNFHGL